MPQPKGQAAKCPVPKPRMGGTASEQAWRAIGQRVRKAQPVGGASGDGRSPFRIVRRRARSTTGSGTGTAEIKARVYG